MVDTPNPEKHDDFGGERSTSSRLQKSQVDYNKFAASRKGRRGGGDCCVKKKKEEPKRGCRKDSLCAPEKGLNRAGPFKEERLAVNRGTRSEYLWKNAKKEEMAAVYLPARMDRQDVLVGRGEIFAVEASELSRAKVMGLSKEGENRVQCRKGEERRGCQRRKKTDQIGAS